MTLQIAPEVLPVTVPFLCLQPLVENAVRHGMEGKVGSLGQGAWGDLIAVDGDPLQDVRTLERVTGVVKAGRLVGD